MNGPELTRETQDIVETPALHETTDYGVEQTRRELASQLGLHPDTPWTIIHEFMDFMHSTDI